MFVDSTVNASAQTILQGGGTKDSDVGAESARRLSRKSSDRAVRVSCPLRKDVVAASREALLRGGRVSFELAVELSVREAPPPRLSA